MKTDAQKLIDAVDELNKSLKTTNALIVVMVVCMIFLKYASEV